jgi:hypothetical protein
MVYACHCTDCQKRSGSAFGLSVWVSRAAIEVTKGSAEAHTSATAEGRAQHLRMCGPCRTRLWSEPPKRPDVAILRGGTLDDTSWLQPVAHIWTRSAQPWFVFPKGMKTYEGQPASMDEVAALWRDYRGRTNV